MRRPSVEDGWLCFWYFVWFCLIYAIWNVVTRLPGISPVFTRGGG